MNQLDVVHTLIKRGAKLELRNKYGNTAVWLACRNGHLEIVRELLNNGADINARNDSQSPYGTLINRPLTRPTFKQTSDINGQRYPVTVRRPGCCDPLYFARLDHIPFVLLWSIAHVVKTDKVMLQ